MSAYATDHAGLETLPLEECLRLAAQVPVGRVGFGADGEFVIMPVNHAVDGNSVVFRSAGGSKLTAAAGRSTVVFEADDYDALTHSGWSVLLTGWAEAVYDEAEIRALEGIGLATWPDVVEHPFWIRIRPTSVTGRRILPRHSGAAASHDAVRVQVFNVLAGEAALVKKTPFGNVGTVLAGHRMEYVWVSKYGEHIDENWFSMKEVDLILVIQGKLKVEFDAPGQDERVLGVGEVLVLPAQARCRAYGWPRDAGEATIFIAAYPTPRPAHPAETAT